MKAKRFWLIECYDGTSKAYEREVPESHLSERQMEGVLQNLAYRDLSIDEIIGASVNRRNKRTSHLQVQRAAQPPFSLKCGENPFYVASTFER